jgi:hypothetical protein
MRSIFLAGGCAGFLVVGSAGLLADREITVVFRDAALGCLAGAMLFRWFWSVLVGTMKETAEINAREAAKPTPETNQHN